MMSDLDLAHMLADTMKYYDPDTDHEFLESLKNELLRREEAKNEA